MSLRVRFVLAAALAVLALGAQCYAQTQITIGQSTSGSWQFQGAGVTTVSLTGSCAVANCISGYVYFGPNAGTYNMWITGANPTLTAASDPDLFAVNMNGGMLNFSFAIGSSSLTGNIILTTLKDGSQAPQFLGSVTITGATGQFASLWTTGAVVPFDLTVSLPSGSATVGQVVSGAASSTTATNSSGELLPVPEPSSIALIGGGLLVAGGLLKRIRRR